MTLREMIEFSRLARRAGCRITKWKLSDDEFWALARELYVPDRVLGATIEVTPCPGRPARSQPDTTRS